MSNISIHDLNLNEEMSLGALEKVKGGRIKLDPVPTGDDDGYDPHGDDFGGGFHHGSGSYGFSGLWR